MWHLHGWVGLGAEDVFSLAGVFAVEGDSAGRVRVASVVIRESPPTSFFPPAIARLQSSGALDPTFDGNGMKVIAVPAGWTSLAVKDAAILPDGRSYFFGSCSDCLSGGKEGYGIFVLRLDADGDPDPTFSGDGWATYADDLLQLDAQSLFVHANGSVTAAVLASLNFSTLGVVTLRWAPSGELDTSYSGSGVGELVPLDTGAPVDLVVNPESGQIILAIQNPSSIAGEGDGFLGLTAQGALDDQFGSAGRVDLELEEGSQVASLEIQSDGKIVAAATIDANGTQQAGFLVARLLTDGSFDDSYDGNGVNRIEFDLVADGIDRASASTLHGGRLVVVGGAERPAQPQAFAILRVESFLIFRDGFERGDASGWLGQ